MFTTMVQTANPSSGWKRFLAAVFKNRRERGILSGREKMSMWRLKAVLCALVTASSTLFAAGELAPAPPALSADEIVHRNVNARGGLQAWRAVQTLEMKGKMQAGGNNRPVLPVPGALTGKQLVPSRPPEQAELPFTLELKRPLKTRLEIQFAGKTALQVYDGSDGWKLRPYLNRAEIEPYTQEEAKAALSQSELDGPLIDYQAKGTKLVYGGIEKVEGRDTYKLEITFKTGEKKYIWIDASTFLEARIEGNKRRLDGVFYPVYVYYRDYRSVNGLMFPHVLETRLRLAPRRGPASEISEQITVAEVKVNPRLDDALFARPHLPDAATAQARSSVSVAPSIAPSHP